MNECAWVTSTRRNEPIKKHVFKLSTGLEKLKFDKMICQCYKAIGSWLACVHRVMDARGRLRSTRET